MADFVEDIDNFVVDIAKQAFDGAQFNLIAKRRRCAMRIDVINICNRNIGAFQGRLSCNDKLHRRLSEGRNVISSVTDMP